MGTANKTNITKRSDKSTALTHPELDQNFDELGNVIDDQVNHELATDPHSQYGYVFNSVADMETATFVEVGANVRTLGYYTPGDGGGNDYEIVAGDTGTADGINYIALNNGLQAKLLADAAVTVRIPTDFATLQEAVDAYSINTVTRGQVIDLLIEAGHTITSGITISNGDYSQFQISSVDAELSANFTSGRLIDCNNAAAPVLNALVNANSTDANIWIYNNSRFFATAGSGMKFLTGSRTLYIGGSSQATLADTVWTDNDARSLWITRSCIVNADRMDVSRSGDGMQNIWVSRASILYAADIVNNDAKGNCVRCHRGSTYVGHSGNYNDCPLKAIAVDRASRAVVNDSSFLRCQGIALEGISGEIYATGCNITASAANDFGVVGRAGAKIVIDASTVTGFTQNVYAVSGATISFESGTSQNAAGAGCRAENGGKIVCSGSTVSNNTNDDLQIAKGATINADGVTTTSGAGSPALADANVSAFNAIEGNQGIIWV